MSSDRSTKDLIEAARKVGYEHLSGFHQTDALRTVLALADRLEEVEEARARIRILTAHWRAVEGKMLEAGKSHTAAYADGVADAYEDVFRDSPGPGPNMGPDMPPSPEPSDPDTSDVPERAESVEPEPEDDPGKPECDRCGERLTAVNATASIIRCDKCWDSAEDPKPADDPWEEIEDGSVWRQRAILDLRDRVTGVEFGQGQNVQITANLIRALQVRVDTLEHHRKGHAEVLNRLIQRVDSLEGHADRGNEAEKGLRDWIHRLIQEDNHARKVRAILRDDLEKIDDFTEALAERVTRLEALDRATTTVHDNLIEELIGRVEALEEERKVSLEARRHLLDEVQKLWMRLDGEA